MESQGFLFAFSLTLFAGLSTGIGSIIALCTKKTNKKFLSVALGFSAGVMIYVSMIEIFFKAKDSLTAELGEVLGIWVNNASFFGGMLLITLIDKLIPAVGTLNTDVSEETAIAAESLKEESRLLRMGIFTALAVAIHNFPEGLATLISALQDPTLGISIAIAIAIHNIPEGIAVSVPIYYATGNKLKAFKISLLSGIAEPIGALVGYILLYQFMSDLVFGIVFAMVGGIMVFISIDQLLPSARDYGYHRLSVYGAVLGMITMAISLMLLA